jgi:hypothetical protein
VRKGISCQSEMFGALLFSAMKGFVLIIDQFF